MGRRHGKLTTQEKSKRSKKTKKRLAVKAEMLTAKAAKRGPKKIKKNPK